MIPEIAAVVAAAKAFVAGTLDGSDGKLAALEQAVDALIIRETRPADAPTYEEEDRTWGEVAIQDEILSTKTKKWYEVTRTVVDEAKGKVKVNIKGAPQPIVRDLMDPVRLRRGVLGHAADQFQILWGATTRTEHAAAKGTGPMLATPTEEEADDGGS